MNNYYTKIIWGALIILVIVGVAYGASFYSVRNNTGSATSTTSSQASSTDDNISLSQDPSSIVLELNKPVKVGNMTLKAWAVTEDSRCPSDVQCIWEGRVKVALNLVAPQKETTAELTIGESASISGTKFTLIEVKPYPISTHKTEDREYRFVFKMEEIKTATVPASGCFVGGCSGQLCTDDPNAVSTCEYVIYYGCYKNASCERQADGKCGWTQTDSLTACVTKGGPQ